MRPRREERCGARPSLAAAAVACLLAVGALGCGESTAPQSEPVAVMGGMPAAGWPQVGALTVAATGHPFCTGVLVRPDAALTAAHCVEGKALDLIRFSLSTADPAVWDTHVAVAAVTVHPAYTGAIGAHDLAVLHLAQAVAVEPAAVTDAVTAGDAVWFVGAGTDADGVHRGKAVVSLQVDQVASTMFSAVYDADTAAGLCFGDSGAPAFAATDEGYALVGIVTTALFADASSTGCRGIYNAVRVAPYAPWIAGVLGESSGCGADGCPCAWQCAGSGCAAAGCDAEDCAAVLGCVASCDGDDPACFHDCYMNAEQTALADFAAVAQCGAAQCASAADADICLETACVDALTACVAAHPCDPLGRECPQGTACAPAGYGVFSCAPSRLLPQAAPCPGDAGVWCADGLACAEGTCEPVCRTDDACPVGTACAGPVPSGFPAPWRTCVPVGGAAGGCSAAPGAQRGLWFLLLR